MAPSQFAIGVPGGMDIVLHAAMLSLNTFVHRTRSDFRRRNLPTRVQVLLDLEKMFTRASRKRIREILHVPQGRSSVAAGSRRGR